ncbi:MAG: hypothetical protein IPN19_14440 [Elusimicrobia bacterium]|nr:hypothetical protein [Elusimicrobiota bacterium]
MKRGKIAEEDFNLFMVTDSVNKAADEIAGFYKNYHSVRYVRDRMVILLSGYSPFGVDRLESQFKDILLKGAHFVNQGPLEEEADFLNLPRLVFPFNRFNFGRLRLLINALNTF